MDPNANIARQRELSDEIADAYGNRSAEEIADLASELAELVSALDAWRRSGGFDPYAQTEVVQKGQPDGADRFWIHDGVGHSGFSVFDAVTDQKLANVSHDTMTGIVDERDGGIIAYALTEDFAGRILTALRATEGNTLEGS